MTDPASDYRAGGAHLRAGRFEEALACYDRHLAGQPAHADAHYNRGLALQGLNRHEAALGSYDRALEIQPDDAEALNNRANALMLLKRYEAALASYRRALQLQPGLVHALYNSGVAMQELKQPARAIGFYEELVKLAPDYPLAKGKLLHARMLVCDWTDFDALVAALDADVRMGKRSVEPFGYLAVSRSPRDLRRCAELYAQDQQPGPRPPLRDRPAGGKIRIGYVSGEFRQQATSVLMVEVFERHDKSRFELHAFDNGTGDSSSIRRRIEAAFDEIVPIATMSDGQAAAAVRERGIDILVDLNGYFGDARSGLFALRPAPVQVNYLGFPGTLGTRAMDYVVADRIVIPAEERDCYVEQVAYLPDTYQPNDGQRAIAAAAPSRREAGLPEGAFVFCSFNNPWKITPEVFHTWMRILQAAPGSVLWLLADGEATMANLRREARQRGVDPGRLVFTQRLPLDQHLARHRLADLFLDTSPCNAHTTASDALWAGLPLLTVTGTTFAGRVATSLLHAIGVPELAAADLAAYESLAIAFARDPESLAPLAGRIRRHRETHPLFDSAKLCRHLEEAFSAMCDPRSAYNRG